VAVVQVLLAMAGLAVPVVTTEPVAVGAVQAIAQQAAWVVSAAQALQVL
jgi:hypothetical protein